MTDCEHIGFESTVEVARLTTVEGGPVIAYSVDLTIRCSMCHEPFCFRGLRLGAGQSHPTVSLNGTELRAPIHPISDPTTGIGLPEIAVEIRDEP